MILYACIAVGAKILAEHDPNSNNAVLAAQCLQCTPKLHRIYTHTAENRIYTFLINQQNHEEEPATFFVIAEESFGRPNIFNFLHRLRKCYELGTHLDFSQLVISSSISSPSLPRLSYKDDENVDGFDEEMEIEVVDCEGDSSIRELSSPAKRSREQTWRKYVRVVILVDLLVCSLMFAIWMTVCKGFRCIRR